MNDLWQTIVSSVKEHALWYVVGGGAGLLFIAHNAQNATPATSNMNNQAQDPNNVDGNPKGPTIKPLKFPKIPKPKKLPKGKPDGGITPVVSPPPQQIGMQPPFIPPPVFGGTGHGPWLYNGASGGHDHSLDTESWHAELPHAVGGPFDAPTTNSDIR